MQQAVVEQHLHHLRNAPRFVKISGHITTAGLEVANHRHLATNGFKIIKIQLNADGVGDREQVKHRIG